MMLLLPGIPPALLLPLVIAIAGPLGYALLAKEVRTAMTEPTKNLCAQIPASLHARVREEQERLGQTLGAYVAQILTEHFEQREKGGKAMSGNARTLAFQVSEDLFGRLKAYLAANHISQRQFVVSLIEEALEEWERQEAEKENTPEEETVLLDLETDPDDMEAE